MQIINGLDTKMTICNKIGSVEKEKVTEKSTNANKLGKYFFQEQKLKHVEQCEFLILHNYLQYID